MNQLNIDKKYLKTDGCAYCKYGNADHLVGIDYWFPKDIEICKKENCKSLREIIENSSGDKETLDTVTKMDILGSSYE